MIVITLVKGLCKSVSHGKARLLVLSDVFLVLAALSLWYIPRQVIYCWFLCIEIPVFV